MALNDSMGGCGEISQQYFGYLNTYKGQFTFGIKYQNALCLNVASSFNLSPYI
jgi:hypothetical protein